MADIAQLGLDVTQFNNGVNQAVSKMDELNRNAVRVTSAFEQVGRGIGTSIKNIVKGLAGIAGVTSFASIAGQAKRAYEEAEKLNEEIAAIGQDDSSPNFRSLDELEKRLDRINKAAKEVADVPSAIQAGGNVVGKLLSEFINDISEGNFSRATLNPTEVAGRITAEKEEQQKILAIEKEKAEVSIKAKKEAEEFAKREEQINDRAWKKQQDAVKAQESARKTLSDIADEQAKAAIDGLLGEQDAQFKLNEMQDDKLAARKEELRTIDQQNRELEKQIELENRATAVKQGGQGLTGQLAKIGGDYSQKIRDANRRDPSGRLAAQLAQQQTQEEQAVKAQIQNQTPAERRIEERSAHNEERDAKRLDKKDEENFERAKRGARSASIDRSLLRRGLKEADKQLGDSGKTPSQDGTGYNDTDRGYLKEIRDAFNQTG